jgi:hypothetical protein
MTEPPLTPKASDTQMVPWLSGWADEVFGVT